MRLSRGTKFKSHNMEEVGVVVGASTTYTARMLRLLARMGRCFLALERVVQNAFEPYDRSTAK